MRQNNINILQHTLAILDQGYYYVNDKKVNLKLSPAQMEKVFVALPCDIEEISQRTDFSHTYVMGRCGYECLNMDSFALARKRYQDFSYMFKNKESKPILVLNLANPVNPGGGVRRGAKAQEEDLCRKSTLLCSLESEDARAYYAYNRSLHTYMGSDAVILTPEVEIIKDENGELLEDSVIVAVMTCAAPMVTSGMEGMTDAQYQDMVFRRITGMLKVAAYMGYQFLILGAFGCGAFGNDAHVVSDLFYKALKEFRFDGMRVKDFFRHVDFAVLDRSVNQYNFKEFSRNFSDFYRDEDEAEKQQILQRIKDTEIHVDRIRGSLFGGAVGDALSYSIEFQQECEIFSTFGPQGLTEYKIDWESGKALISDDTQME